MSGLSHVHSLGVLHRDMKPENIVVDESKNFLVKLIDFGCSVDVTTLPEECMNDSKKEKEVLEKVYEDRDLSPVGTYLYQPEEQVCTFLIKTRTVLDISKFFFK